MTSVPNKGSRVRRNGNNANGNGRHDSYRDGDGGDGLCNGNGDGIHHGNATAMTPTAMEGMRATAIMVSVMATGNSDGNGNSSSGLHDCNSNGRRNSIVMMAVAMEKRNGNGSNGWRGGNERNGQQH